MITKLYAVKYTLDGKDEFTLAYMDGGEWVDYVSEVQFLREGEQGMGKILEATLLSSAWPCPMAG